MVVSSCLQRQDKTRATPQGSSHRTVIQVYSSLSLPLALYNTPLSLTHSLTPPHHATAMAVLLIGSTGNGKSTLGNFILNPDKDHIFGEHQTFKTARTNKPETQEVESASFEVLLEKHRGSTLSVIDTPGIFEDEDRDIEHMVNIIRALHKVGEIRACILVVKFSSKIDTPYKASIKYYSKLLQGVFETNLVVVMTDYACDERSVNLRALQGIDETKIKENILKEIVEVCKVKKVPRLFTIDCLPMSGNELSASLGSRDDIVDHLFTFPPMSTKDLKVAKTDAIIAADKLTVAKLEGEVVAYDERLEQSLVNAHSAHKQVEQHAKRIDTLRGEVEDTRDELTTLDTQQLVEADVWSVNARWRWFKILRQNYEVTSQWPIQNVKYWNNGKCRWIRQEVIGEFSAQGAVKSKCNRGLHAKVTLEVFKRDKYREEIMNLRADMSSKENALRDSERQHSNSTLKHQQINTEIESLQKNIEERKEDIIRLSSEYLTMDECLARFQV